MRAIENFDRYVVGPVLRYLRTQDGYRVLVLADHATPVSLKTHVADPAPFVMEGTGIGANGFAAYNETNAKSSDVMMKSGAFLTETLMKG